MSKLQEQILQIVQARRLFRRGEKILVAVSGGADSMVLLHVLHELSAKNDWHLTVAHLNHQLRGRSSDADEKLVIRAAKKWKLPVVIERADVKGISSRSRLSLEMAARKIRHEFLVRTAARLNVRKIALAHHADDQVELFFLRLLRGSGSEGLSGMKWSSPSPANQRIQLVRPLLGQGKEMLREYAGAAKVPFREDASNASLDFQRNRIRHELLPLLRQKYQPALDTVILRLMDVLGAESAFLNKAAATLEVDGGEIEKVTGFDQLPVALQRRRIQAQLLERGVVPDFDLIERLRNSPAAVCCVGPEIAVKRDANGEIHLSSTESATANSDTLEFDIAGERGKVNFGNLHIQWSIESRPRVARLQRSAGQELFDADKVGRRIILRHWRAGDRFHPIGMGQPVKLQDLFTNQKIPRERRPDLVVATTETGEIFWVEGLRISEPFKLTPETRRQMRWQWAAGRSGA